MRQKRHVKLYNLVTISVKDSIGAGAAGESGVTVTSTLSRNLTSSICTIIKIKNLKK